ncbi:MAG TPA: glycosyltransferase family 4 protein [Actinomycetota bacterium]
MRVALACPYAWDSPGGVQTHVRGLAARLRERGHETLVLAPGRSPAEDPGVVVVARPIAIPFNGSVAPIGPNPRSRPRIAHALEAFRPDVVHVHEPFAPSCSMFAAQVSPAPVVATFHAYADRSALLRLATPLLRRVWDRLTVRLAVSNAAASFVRTRFSDGLRIVPNGVAVERFQGVAPARVPPGKHLLFVNRLERRKGFAFAVETFERLARELPDVYLLVVGDGPERGVVDRVDDAARARLLMFGAVSNAELPPYYAAGDVFLAPAIGNESFGIVLVEAMAAGLPVVGSDIPGYREVVRDNVEGLLTEPGNVRGLVAAARKLFEDRPLAGAIREAALKRARRFSWATVVDEVEAAYREAYAAGRR